MKINPQDLTIKSTLTPWRTLRVESASGRRIAGDARLRALAAWREGRLRGCLVTHDTGVVTPEQVDWTGYTTPAGRKGGAVPPDAERPTVPLQVRVERDVPDLLKREALRRSVTQGALVTSLIRGASQAKEE